MAAKGGISLKLLRQGAMLKSIGAITGQAIERDFVDVMVEVAKDKSPYWKGTNKTSIKSKKKATLSWEVFTTSGYGAYLELGTKRMAARPYFAVGYEVARKEFASKAFR